MIGNVSFGQKMGVFDNASAVINNPQTYTKPEAAPAAKPDSVEVGGKKKHTAAKVIGGIIGTAVVAAGLLAAGKHFGAFDATKVADLTKSFKDSKWISWAKEPAKKVLGALDTAGQFVIDKSKAVYDWGAGLFKKGAKTAESTEAAA